MTIRRNRIIYSILIIFVIILGLCSRRYSDKLPNWIGTYAGDVLWALLIFLMTGFIFISAETKNIAFLSILFSFSVEFSQLYHSPWIDEIRKTLIGGLVLGYGFLVSDLICYLIGIIIGVLGEKHIKDFI